MLWSIIPVIITLFLYIWLLSNLQDSAQEWIRSALAGWQWNPEGLPAKTLLITGKILVFIVGAVTFSITAGIIAAPFNDFLAEATEPHATPPLPPVAGTGALRIARLVTIDIIKSLGVAFATLFALLLSWIPGLNLVAFLLAAVLLSFQYVSYPQTRRGIGLLKGSLFLGRHLFACAGFGLAVLFLFSIPLASIIALPLAVVGGTLLVARAEGSVSLPRLK